MYSVPDVAHDPRRRDRVVDAPDERRRDLRARRAPAARSPRPATARPGTGSSRAGPSGPRRARRSRSAPATSGSSAPRGGVNVAWPMPTASCSGVAWASSAGPVSGSSMRRWAWVRFDSGRKMLPFVMKRCSRSTRDVAAGRVDHRDAGTAVVGEHDHRLEAQHLGHVVLEHLGVALRGCSPSRAACRRSRSPGSPSRRRGSGR